MPKFSDDLEETLQRALKAAKSRKHEYATMEHLLMGLLDDKKAVEVLTASGADISKLKETVGHYLDSELDALRMDKEVEPSPTSGFQRVVQRAILHVQSQGREEVTGINVLTALFSERESYAVYFLNQQDVSRLDVVSYNLHGIRRWF